MEEKENEVGKSCLLLCCHCMLRVTGLSEANLLDQIEFYEDFNLQRILHDDDREVMMKSVKLVHYGHKIKRKFFIFFLTGYLF